MVVILDLDFVFLSNSVKKGGFHGFVEHDIVLAIFAIAIVDLVLPLVLCHSVRDVLQVLMVGSGSSSRLRVQESHQVAARGASFGSKTDSEHFRDSCDVDVLFFLGREGQGRAEL